MEERRLNRMTGYDYSSPGWYFITICTRNRNYLFGEIKNGVMELNATGKIAYNCWKDIPMHFPVALIDEFIVMPDHIHGIVEIHDVSPVSVSAVFPVGNADLRSLRGEPGKRRDRFDRENRKPVDRTKMTIPKIIHGFKSSVTRIINTEYGQIDCTWQKSYYDRIIRTDDELNRVRVYIRNNPQNWKSDGADYQFPPYP